MNTTITTAPPAAREQADFRTGVRRELAQRSDGRSAAAALQAVAAATRTLLAERWAATQAADAARPDGTRRVHYLSMEFLMGRALDNALAALGLHDQVTAAVGDHAPALQAILDHEPDAALGNGGLGRLAACFLDAFAALELPSFGYGVRYEHGMFAQAIEDGRQVELPDPWLDHGNPWELVRPELRWPVAFSGQVVQGRWEPAEIVLAQACDFVVPGHGTERVSTLRQWHAQAAKPIDFAAFCRGAHEASAAHKQQADALNWVLYPDDSTDAGRRLRLRQEFFLVSASLQDMLARHLRERGDVTSFGRDNVVHLNDTHPALAPAELMRLLIDEHGLHWDAAWAITRQATSYTNHTLMPEALETWSVALLEELLPRHVQILYEINRHFLEEIRSRFPGDEALVQRLSLIDENGGNERRARMASLAILASHRVNGVSALHSELMVQTIFADYARLWPERFCNVTNGVTPQRWLAQANPGLAALLDQHIGTGWRRDLGALRRLSPLADDPAVGANFAQVKLVAKQRLSDRIARELGLRIDPASLFDVQIKRIHEYKRQLLNLLHVIARYQAIVEHPHADWTPRTVVFAGKAASAYAAAKRIIRLIHDVANVVNHDPRVGDRLKLVFLPNYGVSLAEAIIPAADLSEQISTAGTEASGTGNMKFALNGALTIGTWDGANIEMAQAIGEERLFVFGLRAEAVAELKVQGYEPRRHAEANPQLKAVLDAIDSGAFSPTEPDRYRGLALDLLQRDPYLLLADFGDYVRTQQRVDRLYRNPSAWNAQALHNIAGMGPFSVDRTIGEYVQRVWGSHPPLSMISDADLQALLDACHADPFAVLGMHADGEGRLWVRALLPGAAEVTVHETVSGKRVGALAPRHPDGFFEAALPRRRHPFDYRLRVRWADGHEGRYADPYRTGPLIGEQDLYYLGEGSHLRPFEVLGAHPLTLGEGPYAVDGVRFAVWAPNAGHVSVIGDFNGWDGRRHPMRSRGPSGIWELFVPHAARGDRYKFQLRTRDGQVLPLKSDPYARAAQARPETASVVPAPLPKRRPLPAARAAANARHAPISIYEVHLGSWRRHPDGSFHGWDDLAAALPAYAAGLGFTHLELLPITEHPFDGSWGYQTLGLYAPTSRFGDADGFARFAAACRAAGLGLILDWVPAHFPSDAFGLARFDGSALFEYEDPREGFHHDWNTLIYHFGRHEVRNFLVGSALYWTERMGADGLRVDAVASMLYRDYSRKEGEWVPNVHGGRENLEAIALLKRVNEVLGAECPGAITLAEESTAFPGVSTPTWAGGLGFHYKWNMGWMHDTLKYMAEDPVNRSWHHDKMSFGLVYAFSENFVLPLSHDEVVHGKGSILGRMPGDDWQRFANLRAYYGFMWGHPGKKLLFMGQEWGQASEWNHDTELPWRDLGDARHAGVQRLVGDLNRLYREQPSLHRLDCDPAGFEWVLSDERALSVYAWLRKDEQGRPLLVVCNLTPVPRHGFRLGVPEGASHWREVLNTDSAHYGGSNVGNAGEVAVETIGAHGRAQSIALVLPPLATLYLLPA